jgi:hypothetical protein
MRRSNCVFKCYFRSYPGFKILMLMLSFLFRGISHGIRVLNDNKTEFGERKQFVAWMDTYRSAAKGTAW